MRLLDFEAEEQPLCRACVRPYDQGAKVAAVALTRDLDRLQEQYRRLSDEACDRLALLMQTRQQMGALSVEVGLLRAENERLRGAEPERAPASLPGDMAGVSSRQTRHRR
jgi:hypothetical protein